MTKRSRPPFRADHVGSFLRPKALLEAREQHKSGSLSRTELRKVEDNAIRDIVRFQEDLGLKGITDGEFRRTYFHIDFLEQLQGVESKGGIAVSFRSAGGNVDFSPPVLHVTGPLRFVPKGKTVVLGLVSTKVGELESKDQLKRPIDEASRHVAIEQLCLSPQCGFSSTVHGNDIARESQAAKLRLVVETAREVWATPDL